MMRRRTGATVLTAMMGAAACGPSDRAGRAEAADAPTIMAGLRWETKVSGAGVGLALFDADGSALLRLACVRGPATMTVTGEGLRAIGSEERLTLGIGDEPFTFVANPTADRLMGVEATGPVPADLLARLPGANAVSVAYGAQRIGPHIPPDPESARMFVEACRKAAGS
jgi:hypothetical protein